MATMTRRPFVTDEHRKAAKRLAARLRLRSVGDMRRQDELALAVALAEAERRGEKRASKGGA